MTDDVTVASATDGETAPAEAGDDSVDDGRKSESAQAGQRPTRAIRKSIAFLTAFLAIVTMLAATIGVWAHRTLLDTDTYVKTVTPLADDPAVIDAIASELTNETMTLLDVETRIREALPEQFRFLSLPLTDAARNEVRHLLVKVMETEKFKKLWVSANRLAHKTVVGILRNDLRYVDTANGEVKVDLVLIAADVIRELGKHISFVGEKIQIPQISSDATPAEVRQQVSASIGFSIPDDFGEITLFKSEQLAAAQRAVVAFDRLVIALVVATFVLLAAAIVISTRRFRMIAILGMTSVLAIAVADAIIRDIKTSAVQSVADPTTRAAVTAGVGALVNSLGGYIRFVAIAGLALAAVGFLGSDTAAARTIRGRVAALWDRTAAIRDGVRIPDSPVLRWISANSTALRVAGLAIAVLAVLMFHPSIFGLVALLVILGAYEGVLTLLAGEEEGDGSRPGAAVANEPTGRDAIDRGNQTPHSGAPAAAKATAVTESSPTDGRATELPSTEATDHDADDTDHTEQVGRRGGNEDSGGRSRLRKVFGGRSRGTAILIVIGAGALALAAGWAFERRR